MSDITRRNVEAIQNLAIPDIWLDDPFSNLVSKIITEIGELTLKYWDKKWYLCLENWGRA